MLEGHDSVMTLDKASVDTAGQPLSKDSRGNRKKRKKKILCEPRWFGWKERALPKVRDREAFFVDVPLNRDGGQLLIDCHVLGSKKDLGRATLHFEDLVHETPGGVTDVPLELVTDWVRGRRKNQRVLANGAWLKLRVEVPKGLGVLRDAQLGAQTLRDTENTLPSLAAVEIDIVRASNLKQADAFSLSDPFVQGWHAGDRLGPTAVKDNTLNPIWDPNDKRSTFRISDVRTIEDPIPTNEGGLPIFDAIDYGVILEVMDSDGPARPAEFLGHCVLRHEDLMVAGEKELELKERTDLVAEAFCAQHGARREVAEKPKRSWRTCCFVECGRCGLVPRGSWGCLMFVTLMPFWVGACAVRGVSKVLEQLGRCAIHGLYCVGASCCCCCPCSLPRRQPVRGRLLVRVRHIARVELRIMEGYNLLGVDTQLLGGSTSDPYCVVEYRGKQIAKTKSRAKTLDPAWYQTLSLEVEVPLGEATFDPSTTLPGTQRLPWEHPARAFQHADEKSLKIVLWDHDTFSGDDVMGQVVVRPEFLLRPQNGTHWPVMSPLDQNLPGQGHIELFVRTSQIPLNLEPAQRRQFGASGRYKECTHAGTGREYWYDIWTYEAFWINPDDVKQQEAAREDAVDDAAAGRRAAKRVEHSVHDAKGATLERRQLEGADVHGDHGAKVKETKKQHAAHVISHLLDGLSDLNADHRDPQMVIAITIIRANDLYNTDGRFGKSDPFAVVRFGRKRIGRTRTIMDDLDPEWIETMQGVLPLSQPHPTDISVEVWDWDAVGDDDFLGEARMNSDLLLRSADRMITLPLCGRPGMKVAKGTVTIHVSLKLKTIIEINSLRRVGSGEPSSAGLYAACVWTGREDGEAGRTEALCGTNYPRWDHKMVLAVPVRWPLDTLIVEIREHRQRTADEVLGQVRINARTILALPRTDADGNAIHEPPILRYALRDREVLELSEPLDQTKRRRRGIMESRHAPSQQEMEQALGEGALDETGAMRDEMSLLESSDGDTDSDHIDDDDYARFEDELAGESSFAHADDASRASARHRHRRKRAGVRGLLAKLSGATRGAFARAGAGRSTTGGAKKSPSASPKFLARALSAGSSLSLKKGSRRSMLTGKAMKERKSSRKRGGVAGARTSPLRRALKRLFGGRDDAPIRGAHVARKTMDFRNLLRKQRGDMGEGTHPDLLRVANPLADDGPALGIAVARKDDRFARTRARRRGRRASARDLGDVLTIRCIAPPGTLAVFANWQHRFDQSPSGNALPRVSAEIEVLRADGLIKADVLGKSDPFAEVYAGGIQIGRTATKRKTLYPKWVDERFLLPKFKGKCLGAQDLLEAKCELRVVDEDIVGKNDFLGYACLDHADLLAQAGWRTLKLKDDPAGIVSRRSKKKKDEIAVAIDRGTLTVRVRLVAHVRITLVGVFDLAETDDARDAIPDPYARVLYRDAKWGDDTPPRTDALRPMWYHVVDVDVPVPDDEVWGDPLTVVVYDKKDRWGERDATIGAVTIPHEHLVYPHDCPGVRDIMGGPDGDEPVGKLTLHVEASCVPGRVEPRRNPDVEPVFVAVRDPRTGRPYWYDSCTLEPVWDDPRPAAEALAAEIAEHERKATAGARTSLPLALLRAKRGFPEPPQSLAAAGACGQARVWWSWPRDMDGHTVLGFTVERQRRHDGDAGDWEDKGSVYVDPAAQAQADAAAAKASGRAATPAELDRARSRKPPTAIVVDELANDAWYRFRVFTHNDVGVSVPSAWSNQTRVIEPLPEGWVEVAPAEGPPYYYNAKMRKTTWSRPEHDPYNLPTDVFLKFTTDELANIKHTFMEKDVDKSHAISLREFESCLPMIGEMLSPTDILWLFYQADLDPKAELDYTAFAKAVDTLKRARVERAPLARTAAAKAGEWWEYYNRPRVPKKSKKLIEKKQEEMALKVGAWEKVPHPQIPGSKYWRNPDTGEASYESPAEVRFFLPEALIREASEHLSDEEMGHLEEQFNAMDLDGSGAIDVGELKLLVKTLTGDVLSDGRARGLMHEVDMDRSGQMDYDEFVLAMVTMKRGKAGNAWSRLGHAIQTIERNEEVEALRQDAGLLKLGTRRQGKKRPHGHYCVCGCRAINSETQKFLKRKRKMRSIFPKLTAKQLKAQSQGGGASAAAALQHRDTIDESVYTAANLIAVQPRMADTVDVPKWSMVQCNHKRETIQYPK